MEDLWKEIISTSSNSSNETIGDRITKVLSFKNISRVKLGELTGIDYNLIRKYQVGFRYPIDENIKKIAEAVQCDYDWLKYGTVNISNINDDSNEFLIQYHNIVNPSVYEVDKYQSIIISFNNEELESMISQKVKDISRTKDGFSHEVLKTIWIILNKLTDFSYDNRIDELTFEWLSEYENINEFDAAKDGVDINRTRTLDNFFKEYVSEWCGEENKENVSKLSYIEKRNIYTSLCYSYETMLNDIDVDGIDFEISLNNGFVAKGVVDFDVDKVSVQEITVTATAQNYNDLEDEILNALNNYFSSI